MNLLMRHRCSTVVATLLLAATYAPASSSLRATEPAGDALLVLDGAAVDPQTLDYALLPIVGGEHAVVSAGDAEWEFRLHNYLIHHAGKYWCMWSHGPKVEDYPTQHVRYAVSDDGLAWSEPRVLGDLPSEGYGYIARDFWLRDGELLALVARYKGRGAFGKDKDLSLEAFAWDAAADAWKHQGRVYADAINNFAPEKLAGGEWMTTRRDHRFNTTMMIGGVKALDAWDVVPVVESAGNDSQLRPDEPIWWQAAGGECVALLRDNGKSGRLFRSISSDQCRTWTTPVVTNFPNARSKVYSLKLSDGRRALINNANNDPAVMRFEMHIAFSDDERTFTRLARLEIPPEPKSPTGKPATFQYPHAIEHDGHLLIAYSRNKTAIEVLKIPLAKLK